MEVNLAPDVQAKLDRLAADTGRPAQQLLEDPVNGLVEELEYTRELLDRRYDEMDSGQVQGIDGEEAYRLLMEKTRRRRQQRPA